MTVQLDQLSNGFRVVSEKMPGLKSAAIGIWVTAGGRNERIEQNGIAHFLEHMAFKGTGRRSALQIAEAIEDVGGYINAYTSREVTAYYARVLQSDVPLAMDVISDIVLNPKALVGPSFAEMVRFHGRGVGRKSRRLFFLIRGQNRRGVLSHTCADQGTIASSWDLTRGP